MQDIGITPDVVAYTTAIKVGMSFLIKVGDFVRVTSLSDYIVLAILANSCSDPLTLVLGYAPIVNYIVRVLKFDANH